MALGARRLSLKIAVVMIVALVIFLSPASGAGCSLQDISYHKEQYWWNVVLYQAILESSLEWTPDGAQIIFRPILNAKGEGSAYVMRADGSEVKRISKSDYDDYFIEMGHTISPDGTRLVYVTSRHQDGRGLDLETSNLDGSDQRRLTQDGGQLSVAPDWSPDGTRIAFIDTASPNDKLKIIRIDGTIELQTDIRARIRYKTGRGPQWSPDGQTVAFVAQVGTGAILYSLKPDETGLLETFAAPVPPNWTNSISNLSWSPDSAWLAFALSYDDATLRENNGLYVVKPDGTGLRRLASWSERVEYLDWSPDGQYIITSQGVLVRVADGATRTIFRGSRTNLVAWSPDGSSIAFSDGSIVFTIARDGSRVRRLVTWDYDKGDIVAANQVRDAKAVDLKICSQESVVPDPDSNTGLVQDCEALLKSRDILAGTSELDWAENKPIGKWEGITVRSSPPRVVEVALQDKEITGSIPPELGRLTELRKLALSGDNNTGLFFGLTGPIPPEIGNLKKLERLDLSSNNLIGSIPSELGDLAGLQALQLQGNNLGGNIPGEMTRLSNLTFLSITNNNFSGCVPIELSDLWVQGSGLERCEAANL